MKKDKDLISVIIPIYNGEKQLSRCLESIINQTYMNLEVILVNDGSTDKTLEICHEYKKNDNRIIIIDKKNEGVSVARNSGLKKAKGKYIYFSDADDYLELNALEIYHKEIQGVELVISDYYLIDIYDVCKKNNSFYKNMMIDSNKELDNLKISLLCNEFKHENKNNNDYNGTGMGFTWNKLFIKEIIDKNDIKFPEKVILSEDVCFMYKYLESIKKVKLINVALYYHEVEETGATLRYKPEIIDSERRFVDETWYITNTNNKQIIDAYYGRLIRMISWDFISCIFHKSNKDNKKYLIASLFKTIPEYRVAIKKAKYKNLSYKQAVFLFLLKLKLYNVIALLIK